jgi:hypothetical protein
MDFLASFKIKRVDGKNRKQIIMDLVVIICHYKEKLDWVNELKHKYIVYNKNENNRKKYDFDLPNVGFDTIVYLTYIIDFYDNLPDFVCFSQDNPFYHCPNFLENVNNFNGEKNFNPLGITYYRDMKNILDRTINYANSIGIECSENIKFINSAQCIVSKDLIRLRTKESYEKIRNTLSKTEIITETNYFIEYLWPTILSFNNELEISINNC